VMCSNMMIKGARFSTSRPGRGDTSESVGCLDKARPAPSPFTFSRGASRCWWALCAPGESGLRDHARKLLPSSLSFLCYRAADQVATSPPSSVPGAPGLILGLGPSGRNFPSRRSKPWTGHSIKG